MVRKISTTSTKTKVEIYFARLFNRIRTVRRHLRQTDRFHGRLDHLHRRFARLRIGQHHDSAVSDEPSLSDLTG